MSGVYESGVLTSGAFTTVSFLRHTLLFLPDPYVRTFELPVDGMEVIEKKGIGYLTVSQRWNADGPCDGEVQHRHAYADAIR